MADDVNENQTDSEETQKEDRTDNAVYFDLPCVIDGKPATIRARRDEYGL